MKSLQVKDETWQKLMEIRTILKARSLDEVITTLIVADTRKLMKIAPALMALARELG